MTKEKWIDLSNKIPAFSRVTITGGEPLVFAQVQDILREVAGRHQCNLITNGTLLNEELLDLLLSLPKFKILAVSIDNLLSSSNNIRGYTEKQWSGLEGILGGFIRKRDAKNSECRLEIKTLILDENSEELFDIHKYCMEVLKADYHNFQFLKGSPLQHSEKTVELSEVFKTCQAPVYKKFDTIIKELDRIKAYNIKYGKRSFLHPNLSDIYSKKPAVDLSYLNVAHFDPNNFKSCKFPWSSVHINHDGRVFPCLSVPLGNLKDKSLNEIFHDKPYRDFLRVIKKAKLFQACNRCGWLRPAGKIN